MEHIAHSINISLVALKKFKGNTMDRHYYSDVYKSTVKKCFFIAVVSTTILIYSYFAGWFYTVSFAFYMMGLTILTSVSVSYAICLLEDNRGVGPRIAYSKKQKALVVFLALIQALMFFTVIYSIIKDEEICKDKEGPYKYICLQELKGFVIFKYTDTRAANAIKEVREKIDYTVAKIK